MVDSTNLPCTYVFHAVAGSIHGNFRLVCVSETTADPVIGCPSGMNWFRLDGVNCNCMHELVSRLVKKESKPLFANRGKLRMAA